jgi:hypothetical protein
VLEYMNKDWWRGRNERTGQEGIFPMAYVRVEKSGPGASSGPPSPPQQPNSGYGNMPLDVSQAGSGGERPSKFEENGKKFGKKLGNAAIFGAVGHPVKSLPREHLLLFTDYAYF